MRTRRSLVTAEKPNIITSPRKTRGTVDFRKPEVPRKLTRSSSNVSNGNTIFVGGIDEAKPIRAICKKGRFLIIAGIPSDFLSLLEQPDSDVDEDEHSSKTASHAEVADDAQEDEDDLEDEPDDEPEEEPSPGFNEKPRKRKYKRRRRTVPKILSPVRKSTRQKRVKALSPEADMEDQIAVADASSVKEQGASNITEEQLQLSAAASAHEEHEELEDLEEEDEQPGDETNEPEDENIESASKTLQIPVPKISLSKQASDASNVSKLSRSATGDEQAGEDGEREPTPELIDDTVRESDLPAPFRSRSPTPPESSFPDQAAYLVKTRFKPITDPQLFISALSQHDPSKRSTASLYALALNTQRALVAWQDEYLKLDARTAPHAHPAKKPAKGGREIVEKDIWEGLKEAELYNYSYDHRKTACEQNPFAQRIGRNGDAGRELRGRGRRKAKDVDETEDDGANTAAVTDVAAEETGPGRRPRREVKKYDGVAPPATPEPIKVHGNTGRKRRLDVSATPEQDGRKRGKHNAFLPARVREMRAESAVSEDTTNNEEEQKPDGYETERDSRGRRIGKRRGRPKGYRRSSTGQTHGYTPQQQQEDQQDTEAMEADPNPDPSPGSSRRNSISQPPTPVNATPTIPPTMPPPPPPRDTTELPQPIPNEAQFGEGPITPVGTSSGPTGASTNFNLTFQPSSRKPRVKSEKRSKSMTKWWAERKEKAALARANGEVAEPAQPRRRRSNLSGGAGSGGNERGGGERGFLQIQPAVGGQGNVLPPGQGQQVIFHQHGQREVREQNPFAQHAPPQQAPPQQVQHQTPPVAIARTGFDTMQFPEQKPPHQYISTFRSVEPTLNSFRVEPVQPTTQTQPEFPPPPPLQSKPYLHLHLPNRGKEATVSKRRRNRRTQTKPINPRACIFHRSTPALQPIINPTPTPALTATPTRIPTTPRPRPQRLISNPRASRLQRQPIQHNHATRTRTL
ncbi:hypothetical protein M501DRAFT_660314 [Patellaria atrata CBS 101060]|uniref:Uncharacterized protein n=1 Tax=Patellaria atrata CBS 101060 TaxID=1346257 RepID=A0A9P4VUV8_9PEZI|nr:hypothetical protein M501DRAFT_660314 [Patellaria atrata CBS 101060]